MKKKVYYILIVCLCVSPMYATHYEITTDTYTAGLTLQTSDSLYMTDGGLGGLTLRGSSTATIEGTATLVEGSGGIWLLSMWDSSHLDFWNGEVHEIDLHNSATVTLRGGLIESIYSYQTVTEPHITLYHSGAVPIVQEIGGFDFLIGNWGSGDPFSIRLHYTGYNVYGNFEFILVPEPATLALLGLGGVLLRKRKR